ncbi:histidine kinase [Paenibacillus agaridevorans]|uniref:histidine kinase n=1 Tax=Paenibacillus agaridevorans TaxID=171404 RepID=A0A2R5EU23_9BACL|nr:HAMP domain-containing sensor histidine kinase [Paenibacillus agaridevorans]GBG09169.1 histidine kinase [Paenibacillus agaridevorans]
MNKRNDSQAPVRKSRLLPGSLQGQYLIIVLAAFLFIPVIIPLASLTYTIVQWSSKSDMESGAKYGGTSGLLSDWHAHAANMEGKSDAAIDEALIELKRRYPEASMFWVDANGATRSQLPPQLDIPAQWTPEEAIRFMKASIGKDPYTVIAFLGKENAGSSFMTIRMPREAISTGNPNGSGTPYYIAFVFVMFSVFVAMSLLFFRHIRRRLLRLQSAMARQDEHGIPEPVAIKRWDEIGALEYSFNGMVAQLRDSRQRQSEEEQLRKSLVANLSHDLRTPLTIMQGHLYQLREEPLSPKGQQSVSVMQGKAEGLGELIDNLLAYTLMTSGRYKLTLEAVDIVRLARESAASWYPLWEREGLEVDVRLPHEQLIWQGDRAGLQRMLDNLFQNVVRHARDGGYIGLALEKRHGRPCLVFSDKGRGLNSESSATGAGVGLAIVDYLADSMGLVRETASSEEGTRVYLYEKTKAKDERGFF